MESAIDKHLQCPRALSRRVADDYDPPFPMWVARAKEDICQVVMGYFGVQYLGAEKKEKAMAALRRIVSDFALPDGPGHYDLTYHQDAHGYENLMAAAYWRDPNAHKRWLSSPVVSGRWESEDRLQEEVGYFREIVAPRAEQLETLYAFREQLPGVGATMDGIGGEVQEHGRSLDLLERWAEAHPTHLRIFTTFFRVAADLSKLRLYHEVSVFNASDQLYEYINCHPQTGMMRDAMVPDG